MSRSAARRLVAGISVVGFLAALLPAAAAAAASGAETRGDNGDEARGPVLGVGAAAVDVTPPLAGPDAANPAACAGATAFTGPHLFSLEEPYTDTNGNGHFDPGEPFLDCPVPLVGGGVAPPDGRWDGIYLAGGNCCDRTPTALLDPIWSRTIAVSNGHRTVTITSVDNEGVFKEIWDRVRAKVAADLTGRRDRESSKPDEMFFSSTHDESAPDTIGITGPSETVSGVDPFYVELLVSRVAASVEQAVASRRPARLRFGSIRPNDMTTCWSSYPFAADEQIGVVQAVRADGRGAVATLVNYGIHAEELGFSTDGQDRRHLSSDWPNFARRALEERFGGMAMTMAGSVGSVEMPQVYPAARDLTPVGVYRSTGNGGCRTIYRTDDTRVPYGYLLSTRARGERIAQWAARALERGAWSRSRVIDTERATFFMPLENALFAYGGAFGVIAGKDGYVDGRLLHRNPAGVVTPFELPNQIKTDVAYYRIGDAEFVSAPGEVFPYTYARDFGGPQDQAVPDGLPPPPWVMARLAQPWRFVEGLGEDMIGYIFPKTNAVGVPRSLAGADDTDRFGCGHSDDAEAAAADAGDVVIAHLTSLLPDTPDRIVPGRYLWRDGTQHRSPLAEGGQACSGPANVFRPAPGGAGVGVVVGARRILVDGTRWRWMDLRGRPEAAPSTQTRGIVGADGRRIWVDVFPDVSP